MWQYILALTCGLCLLSAVVLFARRDAKRAEHIKALKREIKEREYANRVCDAVRNMPIDSVREKLKDTK